MPDPSNAAETPAEVTVHLLDLGVNRTVKSWTFCGKASITIGRDPDCDVEINDPYVSRNHAELHLRDGRWVLVTRGRNGVLVNNRPIEEHVAVGDVTFRLGTSGPTLRFQPRAAVREDLPTLCHETVPIELFRLDQSKLKREVSEIADADYFQKLQERVKSLRKPREREDA